MRLKSFLAMYVIALVLILMPINTLAASAKSPMARGAPLAATPAPTAKTFTVTFDTKNRQQPFASAARTATATSSVYDVGNVDNLISYLSVTAASGTSPTLDVKAQDSPDGGTTWFDIAGTSHTQATGATSEVKSATRKFAPSIRFVATIAGTSPSFTFSLTFVSY
jgi:hypothetical protein